MATKTKTTNPTPVAQAQQAAADAAARHAAAEQAATLAAAASAELIERLAIGDDAVTSDDLMRSDSEARRTTVLLEHAVRALAARKAEQAITVATATAADLATSDGFDLTEAVDTTRATIAAALSGLREQIAARNARLAEAVTTAEGAGLIAGEADPMSPVLVRRRSRPGSPHVLLVNGVSYAPIDASTSVASVLSAVSA